MLDVAHRRWSKEILQLVQMEESLLPHLYESPEICGRISAAGAAATGLQVGTPVVAGAGDQAAGAIGMGIENYQALPIKKQPPMLVADYRRETKSAPVEPVAQEGSVKEADASLLELVGRSAFLPPQQKSSPAQQSSLESAPIVP